MARPWAARFRNGPCAGAPGRVWAGGEPWQVIKLAPMPVSCDKVGDEGQWVITGGDEIGVVDEPWSGEVVYGLLEVQDGEVVGEPGRVAWYGLISPRPAPTPPEDPPGQRYFGD